MYYKEIGQGEDRNGWTRYEIRITKRENLQDQLLTRRKFLKMSMGASVGLAVGSIGVFGYGAERVRKNATEVGNEYPKPSIYEYENAVNEVERYNQRENLYHQCKEITNKPKTCEMFRPKNITEIQHARSTLERQDAHQRELHKRDYPWTVTGLFSAAFTLAGVSRAIVSGIQLRRVNREIRELREGSNPSETPPK